MPFYCTDQDKQQKSRHIFRQVHFVFQQGDVPFDLRQACGIGNLCGKLLPSKILAILSHKIKELAKWL